CGDLLGSDTDLVTLGISTGGLALEAVGDGVGELLEFVDIEDPAGNEIDDDHDDANDPTSDDRIADRGHGPACGGATHGRGQGDTEDPGYDRGPAGPDISAHHFFDPVITERSFDQDVGQCQLEHMDHGED